VEIDNNSKKKSVRKFFVQHKGKKPLTVRVGPLIYGVDSWLFDQMSEKIAENINVPNYVDKMRANFSDTTKVQKIAIMTSVQEYFEYRMQLNCSTAGIPQCGIPAIEMKGNNRAECFDCRNNGSSNSPGW